jgi:hypothetical protein
MVHVYLELCSSHLNVRKSFLTVFCKSNVLTEETARSPEWEEVLQAKTKKLAVFWDFLFLGYTGV